MKTEGNVITEQSLLYLQQIALENCIDYLIKNDGLDQEQLRSFIQCHALCFGELEQFLITGELPERPKLRRL